jgi:hypothetical protein
VNFPTSFFLLAVGGTAADDHIIFRPGGLAGAIVVQLYGVLLVTFRLTASLLAFGKSGIPAAVGHT